MLVLTLYSAALIILIALVSSYFIGLINVIHHTAPFVPTGKKKIKVVKQIMRDYKIKSLVDLGSGDGNLLINVADCGIYATGYETNPFLYLVSLIRKRFSKNGKYLAFYFRSLFDAKLHNYDAIFIYGIAPMMQSVETKILREAKKGTIVISNTFAFDKPNKYCPYCDSGNKDNATKCWRCGGNLTGAAEHETRKYLQGESPRNAEETAAADDDKYAWVEPDTNKPKARVIATMSGDSAPTTPMAPMQRSSQRTGPEYTQTPAQERYMPQSTRTTPDIAERVGDIFSAGVDWCKRSPLVIGGVALVGIILLSILGYQLFFNTHMETVTVAGYSWEQKLVVDEYQAVHESCWSNPPSGAYNITEEYKDTGRDKKVHDGWKEVEYTDTCYQNVEYQDTCYRDVPYTDSCPVQDCEPRYCTGQRDNGDGSFTDYDYQCGQDCTTKYESCTKYQSEPYSCTKTRSEPYSCKKTKQEEVFHYEDIYDNYYTYDIHKWITVGTYTTSGQDHKPYYQPIELGEPYSDGTPELGMQKCKEVPIKYTVTFFCKDNPKVGEEGYFTRDYPQATWEMFTKESTYEVEVNVFNTLLTKPEP